MMITLLIIAFAVLAVGIFSTAFLLRKTSVTRPSMRMVDLKAYFTLIDRDDETFLREKLPNSAFRRLKRQRIAVTLKYVDCIWQSVAAAAQVAQLQCESPDPAVAQQAAQVMNLATGIRKWYLLANAKLRMEYAFPSLRLTPAVLAPEYQVFREQINRLGSLGKTV
jgi:hypothetical protein